MMKTKLIAIGMVGRVRFMASTAAAARNVGRPSALIDRIIRVDHAGEYGANRIYAGQLAVLGKTSVGPVIEHMSKQEEDHLRRFNELIPQYRVRPTALMPLWHVSGYLLGAGTALLGSRAAMACTVAVEQTITEHYNNQLRTLLAQPDPETHKELMKVIQKCRDEEMEHHDTGLAHEAEKSPFYDGLTAFISTGCKVAIWLSERI